MNSKQLILLALHSFDNQIRGKTLLQKRMYFLDILLKEKLRDSAQLPDLDFIPYYYGPYSPVVNEDLIYMKLGNYISESSVEFDFVNDSGFQAKRTDFILTDNGRARAIELERENPDLSTLIKNICDTISNIDNNSYEQLAIDAKTHFILTMENRPLTKENIKEIAKNRCKWVIDNDVQIEKAVEHLKTLELVETQ